MTIKFPKGSKVRCVSPGYEGGGFTDGKIYEVREDYEADVGSWKNVMIVEDDFGSITNGWSQKFFEAVKPAISASYAHSPGYQQSSPHGVIEIGSLLPGGLVNVKTIALQTQVGGAHYTDMTIQPIEYIQANCIPFPEGNIIKYVSRWRAKGGIKDLEKAKHHLELLIEFETAKVTK